jgi:hypothetical protein
MSPTPPARAAQNNYERESSKGLHLTLNQKGSLMENWTPETMGSKGGKKSRRTLTSKQAKDMVKKREEKRKREAILREKARNRSRSARGRV